MAVKGVGYVTMLDVAKKGNRVAEVLSLRNSALKDIPYTQMNEGTIHKESIRSFLPSPVYRKANQGLAPTKGGLEERTFSASHFESRSSIDQMVAERGGKDRVKINRWNQAMAHIQGMANEHGTNLIYGSPSGEGNKEPGLADIYYSVSSTVNTYKNVIDFNGTGSDNTSVYLVNWGPDSIFGVYPAGTTAGLSRTDYSAGGKLVQIPMLDASGAASNYYGYDEIFKIDHGLVVKDWRQAVRICNIDVSDFSGASPADLLSAMVIAMYKLDSLEGNPVFYCNRLVHAVMHKLALSQVKAGGGLTFMNYGGEMVLSFNGIPVRIMDAIAINETRVV